MPYFNIDLDYFDHPKTLLLETELGGHRATLIPIRLWAHVGKYHSDGGFLKGYTPGAIAKAVDYDQRHSEKLVEVLIKCGFLVKKRDGYQVHDWSQHNGHLALFRERAKLAAEARWNKPRNADSKPENNPVQRKSAVVFTDEQIHEIRSALAKSCKHRLISEANEKAWQDLKIKVDKAIRKKKIQNVFAYAIKAAMNSGGPNA